MKGHSYTADQTEPFLPIFIPKIHFEENGFARIQSIHSLSASKSARLICFIFWTYLSPEQPKWGKNTKKTT